MEINNSQPTVPTMENQPQNIPLPNPPQKSSKVLLIVGIIVLLLIVGLGSFYVGTKMQSTNTQPSYQAYQLSPTTPVIRVATPTSVSQTSPTPTGDIKSTLTERVLQFYKDYAQFQPNSLDVLYQKGYLTVDGYTTLKKSYPYDPVLCTQGGSANPLTVDSVTVNGQTGIVTVKQYYDGSKTYNYINLTLGINDQKISSITCNLH